MRKTLGIMQEIWHGRAFINHSDMERMDKGSLESGKSSLWLLTSCSKCITWLSGRNEQMQKKVIGEKKQPFIFSRTRFT